MAKRNCPTSARWPVIPPQVEHYTILMVQGLDLGILLPAQLPAVFYGLEKHLSVTFKPPV
jgi:hypothetical protein